MGKVQIPKYDAQGNKFPDLCMCCGVNPSTHAKPKNFAYINPIAYIGIFCGLLPFLIIALIMQKKQMVNVHLCDDCEPGYKSLPQYGCLTGILFVCLLVVGAGMAEPSGGGPGNFIILGAFLTPVLYLGYYAFTGRRYAITCANIDDQFVTLNLPNSHYAGAYANHRSPSRKPAIPSAPTVKKCRHCAVDLADRARFCQSCGQSQEA
jgi:hypothetical protein